MTYNDALAGKRLAALSTWLDEHISGDDPSSTVALDWARIGKIGEEFGEVIEALIGWTGQNPRKGVTHVQHDVTRELLDVAVTALGAVEHLTGNRGASVEFLFDHIAKVAKRAGVES